MTPDDIKPRLETTPTIIVVDDTEGVRKIISIQLRMLGYRVLEAAGGREAVELARSEKPALILMDINMPDMDGLETAKMIRRSHEVSDIPIIGLSAHHGMEMSDLALEAGFNEFYQKPLAFRELADLVGRHLSKRQL